jgi:hypothetical protein
MSVYSVQLTIPHMCQGMCFGEVDRHPASPFGFPVLISL